MIKTIFSCILMPLTRPVKLLSSIFLPKELRLLLKLASSNLSIITSVSSGSMSVCTKYNTLKSLFCRLDHSSL